MSTYFKIVSTVIPSFDGQPSAIIACKTDSALASFASIDKLENCLLIGGERSLLRNKLLSPLSIFPRGDFSSKVLESCGSIADSLRSAHNDQWLFLLSASLPSRHKVEFIKQEIYLKLKEYVFLICRIRQKLRPVCSLHYPEIA